jgi:hypothetical protein
MFRLNFSGLLRASCVTACLAAAILACLLSTAKARLGESLIEFGEQLTLSTGGTLSSGTSHFVINGLEFNRLTSTTPLSVKQALDRLNGFCQQRAGVRGPDDLLTASTTGTPEPLALGGSYRHEAENAGVLACIDTGGPLSVPELTTRLKDFARTGNLSSVGRLRYVLARREKSVTSILALWTDGDAPILHLFPKAGDAPGRDIPDVPRPENSERVLSAWQPGVPYALTVYRSRGSSIPALSHWYEAQLTQHGWRVIPARAPDTLIAQQGTRTLIVRSATARGGGIATSVAEL